MTEYEVMATITWKGASGQTYTSVLYQIGQALPKRQGIYIFCKQNPSNPSSWPSVYVGEAEDLDDRANVNLRQHHRYECLKREGATHVCAIQTSRKDECLTMETDLRNGLNPPCNRQ